jgi:magnesium-transporting ATPase (P-type)
MVILFAIVLGVALPITPVQVLWVNTVTAISLALALAFEPLEGDVMARPPRPAAQGLMGGLMIARVLWVGAAMTAGTFGLYLAALAGGAGEAESRTVALNTLVVGELVYLFNARRWSAASWHPAAFVANPWALWAAATLVLLQVAVSYLPFAQRLLGTAAIGSSAWLWIAGFGLALFVLVELEKAMLRRRGRSGLH